MKGLRPYRPPPPIKDDIDEPDATDLLPLIETMDLQARCMTPAALDLKRSTPMFLNPVLPEDL